MISCQLKLFHSISLFGQKPVYCVRKINEESQNRQLYRTSITYDRLTFESQEFLYFDGKELFKKAFLYPYDCQCTDDTGFLRDVFSLSLVYDFARTRQLVNLVEVMKCVLVIDASCHSQDSPHSLNSLFKMVL